jgi:hypothetical protein
VLRHVRLKNGHAALFLDTIEIGRVFKFRDSRQFGLELYGIYWDTEGNVCSGGAVIKSFLRKRDAIAYAEKAKGRQDESII